MLLPFLRVAHSIGEVANNMAGGGQEDVLSLYPECAYCGKHASTVTLGGRRGDGDEEGRVGAERERDRKRERNREIKIRHGHIFI